MMKQSGLQFTESQLLKIVGGLGDNAQWKQALSVVEWAYTDKEHRHCKSRYFFCWDLRHSCMKNWNF